MTIEAIRAAERVLHEAGYPDARLCIVFTTTEAIRAQKSRPFAEAIVEQGIRPRMAPKLAGARILAIVDRVCVYVKEATP